METLREQVLERDGEAGLCHSCKPFLKPLANSAWDDGWLGVDPVWWESERLSYM